MPIVIEESIDPRTTGTYEPDRVPQGFQAPDTYGRMRPNEFSGVKIGGGYDAPRGTSTWEPSWDQTSGITHQDLGGYDVMPAKGSKWHPRYWWQRGSDWEHGTNFAEEYLMGDEGMAQANREYNKFQIRANEPDARAQRLWMYNQARDENKQPMFFDTVPAPDDPNEDWIHRMRYFDTPETMDAKIDLDEIFRMYPDTDMWRLIQNLDARGIEYANNERSNNEYQMARNWNLDELDATNKLINLYNSFYGNALEYGDQDDADQWLIQIQNLMGQLPRANRGGIIGLI